MKTYSPYDRNNLHINANDRVLEIGSGHSPSYRANVVVEKFINTNYHRCDDIKVYNHQIFIHADGSKLPFKDKEFDYVICNQVLEHVDNPQLFIAELCRVAKRGYIETPSLIGEYLFPKESHKWAILDIDDKLVMYEKSKMPCNFDNDYGELFLYHLPFQSLPYRLLWLTEKDIFINHYEWKDTVEVIINPKDEYYQSFFANKWDKNIINKLYPTHSLFTEIHHTINAMIYILKTKIKDRLHHHESPLTLAEYSKTHKIIHYQYE